MGIALREPPMASGVIDEVKGSCLLPTAEPPPLLVRRLIRYADLVPCRNALVDNRATGADATETFTLIGPARSANPSQHVHIPLPHGFNVGGARQPPGCRTGQRSLQTAEVFVVHRGSWRMTFGVDGTDGEALLEEGDVVSLPTRMFRGFENVGATTGFLFAVLAGDDPGRVTWAPSVFELARANGLVLLEGGRLVDTTKGETVPLGARRQRPPTAAELAKLRTPPDIRVASCVVRSRAVAGNPVSLLARNGVEEAPVITPARTADGFAPGPIAPSWPHGFNLRALRMQPGSSVRRHIRSEPEVLFVHRGVLQVSMPEGELVLGPGDTFTTPVGMPRDFRACSSETVLAYVVRGGDSPEPPLFV